MNKIAKVMTTALAAATIAISAGAMSASASDQQTAKDTQFLNEMGVCPDRWGESYTFFHWSEVSNWADGSWAKAGVCSVSHWWGDNEYFVGGKQVTQKEAYAYAAEKLGKPYDEKRFFPELSKPKVNKRRRPTVF